MDGTLIEAGASLKSFRRKDQEPGEPPDDRGNPTVSFRGERRSNQTHQSSTDPESLLARKGAGKEAKLCYSGNALAENRNNLLIDFMGCEQPANRHKLSSLKAFFNSLLMNVVRIRK